MTHETAQQRARRHNADPYRAAQLAPLSPVPPNVCEACKHAVLIHAERGCLYVGCTCGGAT